MKSEKLQMYFCCDECYEFPQMSLFGFKIKKLILCNPLLPQPIITITILAQVIYWGTLAALCMNKFIEITPKP